MITEVLKHTIADAKAFADEANAILGAQGVSKSRVLTFQKLYDELALLSLRQDDLFQEAIKAAEHECYRAGIVMAWAAFMSLFEDILFGKRVELQALRPRWTLSSVDELRENYPEHQLIDAARELKIVSRTQGKALLGLLNKRNECAHPTGYKPEVDETLGFFHELLQRIKQIS